MVIVHRQGFILSRDIENACIETELSLIDTDWVTSRIIQQDIPILEEAPKSEDNSKVEAHRNENFSMETTRTSNEVSSIQHIGRESSGTMPDGIYYCRGKDFLMKQGWKSKMVSTSY